MSDVDVQLNLREIVLEWLDDMSGSEPREIADAMMDGDAIDEDDLFDALHIALPYYISYVRRTQRKQVTDAMAPDDDEEEEVEVGGEKVHVRRSGKKTRSRWDYRRDFLTTKWQTDNGSIELGTMTREDVRAVVKYYQRIAAENTAMAQKFQGLLSAFKRHPKAKTVADLPEQAVREALPGVE